PITEHLPEQSVGTWLARAFPRASRIEAGKHRDNLRVNGVEVLPLLCYEGLFSRSVRERVTDHTALLVSLSYDGWLGGHSGPVAHHALTKLRAVELGLPLVRAASTGISSIIDERGRTVASAGIDQRTTLRATIRLPQAASVYRRIGDA